MAQENQQPMVIAVSGDQMARERLGREYQALMANANPNESAPGGVFEDAPGAGTFHNANGQPVTAEGKVLSAEQARRQADAAAEQAQAEAEAATEDAFEAEGEEAQAAGRRAAARKSARRGH